MPTKREREYYQLGFRDGMRMTAAPGTLERDIDYRRLPSPLKDPRFEPRSPGRARNQARKPKRKLSAWNKYVKANSNKPRFRYKSGAKKGKLNLRAMGVAFRKTPAGKKKRR